MSHNFKPGDLALIVGATKLTDQIGVVCELDQYLREGDEYRTPNGNLCRAGLGAWLVIGESVSGRYLKKSTGREMRTPGQALVSEKFLMPLRGDFIPEQQKAKEAV
ncbi:hypothetical protein [Pseudomonas paracarnis]|uniref:hypothetical protein n=1 Tax=Pseudomonas paracarnis TaxID=2750625 RepID=UPI001C6F83CD|nr:hypothetical protein [Pseudomonas paracarnis]MBW9244113.1 hypothetical protein [Pseudomonas paracarnis]